MSSTGHQIFNEVWLTDLDLDKQKSAETSLASVAKFALSGQ